ncbi:MAG: heavy-metal-associated domain-containing protein [Cyclobacteriaceae bacterium]
MKLLVQLIIVSLVMLENAYSVPLKYMAEDRLHHAQITFSVYSGDCKECVKMIEKVIRKLPGIESVEFDRKRKVVYVIYDPIEQTVQSIKQSVSKLGFDTDTTSANDVAFDKLSECCKYKRPPK